MYYFAHYSGFLFFFFPFNCWYWRPIVVIFSWPFPLVFLFLPLQSARCRLLVHVHLMREKEENSHVGIYMQSEVKPTAHHWQFGFAWRKQRLHLVADALGRFRARRQWWILCFSMEYDGHRVKVQGVCMHILCFVFARFILCSFSFSFHFRFVVTGVAMLRSIFGSNSRLLFFFSKLIYCRPGVWLLSHSIR